MEIKNTVPIKYSTIQYYLVVDTGIGRRHASRYTLTCVTRSEMRKRFPFASVKHGLRPRVVYCNHVMCALYADTHTRPVKLFRELLYAVRCTVPIFHHLTQYALTDLLGPRS